MKTILMTFLILASLVEACHAGGLYSGVCGRKYTEGRMKVSTNGQIKYECLNKQGLAMKYLVHENGKCNNTHFTGQKVFGRNNDVNKECTLKETVVAFQDISSDQGCDGSLVDGDYHFLNLDGFPTKRCFVGNLQ